MLFPATSATKLGTSALKDSLLTLLLSALAVFAPVKEMCFAILFLVAVDTLTGLWAVAVTKSQFTSRKLSRTIVKVLVYITTICVTYIANKFLLSTGTFSLPLETLIGSFIALTEVKSILENLQKIQKQPLLQFVIDKISSDTTDITNQLAVKQTQTSTTEVKTVTEVSQTDKVSKPAPKKLATVTPIKSKSKKTTKGKKNGSANRQK